jgi:hypothetical protein
LGFFPLLVKICGRWWISILFFWSLSIFSFAATSYLCLECSIVGFSYWCSVLFVINICIYMLPVWNMNQECEKVMNNLCLYELCADKWASVSWSNFSNIGLWYCCHSCERTAD